MTALRNGLGSMMIVLICLALAATSHAGDVGDYLTKDGKLKETVTFKTGGVDFLAPPGHVWVIEPSGDWTRKHTGTKGKLTAKQLAALAQHLAAQDFKSLPNAQGFDIESRDAGYHYIVIAIGKKEVAFYTKIGESYDNYLPKSDDPKAAAWSRFIALKLILADMLEQTELKQNQDN
jgi:hypothetical protein